MNDREAITDLIYRYCRAMDRIDHDLGTSIWHADGTADYGDAYRGSGHGFIDHVCAQHRGVLNHSHQMTNIIIEISGDHAGGSESYFTTALRLDRGGQLHDITVRGRYIDSWSKRDGRWGIDHRIALRDFDEIRAVTPLGSDARGRRDRDDPSYGVLR